MSYQYDSLAFNESRDKAIITCMCGSLECGVLMFHKDRATISFDASYTLFGCGWWKRLRSRFDNAYRGFSGKPVSVGLEISLTDAEKLGEWLRAVEVNK